MTNSLRQRRRQMLEAEILDATREILAERGYVAMSMDDLAAQVGISKPTLYSHFATKDEIVVATIVREMERFIALVEAETEDQTPLQRLIFVLHTLIHVQEDKRLGTQPWTPELFLLVCSREEGRHAIQRLDAVITALIQAGIASGEIDPSLDPSTVASAFYAMSHALKHAHFTRAGATHPAAGEMLAKLFERGVRAPKEPEDRG
jgi:AcrR family transcriptional regulator